MLPAPCINLLLVDDHPLVREGLVALIHLQANMRVVAEASSGKEGIAAYRAYRPDVTLMDLSMPDMNGLEATAAILAEFTQARIIILSVSNERFPEALQRGAKACLLKEAPIQDVFETIRQVHRNG